MNAAEFVDYFIDKNPWIMSRLWDDDCICPNEETVDPKCLNRRCKEILRNE